MQYRLLLVTFVDNQCMRVGAYAVAHTTQTPLIGLLPVTGFFIFMKIEIECTVTYKVSITVEVDQATFDVLRAAEERGKAIDLVNPETAEAAEWLGNNIEEGDAMDWECEIDSLEVEE